MNTKHTPGKWHTEEPFNVWSETGALIARVNCPMDPKKDDDEFDPPWEMGCANARLIAAAPELLEKAKEMHSVASLHCLECLGNSHAPRFMEAINDLEAAISKAEGKP